MHLKCGLIPIFQCIVGSDVKKTYISTSFEFLLFIGSTNKAMLALVKAAHVSSVAGPPPNLFFVLIANLKTEYICLKER